MTGNRYLVPAIMKLQRFTNARKRQNILDTVTVKGSNRTKSFSPNQHALQHRLLLNHWINYTVSKNGTLFISTI